MPGMLFEMVEGQPRPRLPRNPDGSVREADGVRLLTLAQAAERFGRTERQLEELYRSTFADLLEAAPDPPHSPTSPHPHTPTGGGESGDVGRGGVGKADAGKWEAARRDVLHAVCFPELSDDDFASVLEVCRRRGLDPWGRQVWARRRWDENLCGEKLEVMLTIEGFRARAHRTGLYAGCDDATFAYGDDEQGGRRPVKASIVVYKLVGRTSGEPRPFRASALWDEFYPGEGNGALVEQMPHHMLGKVVEALALRKAFPEELGGLYLPEELGDRGIPARRDGQSPGEPSSPRPTPHDPRNEITPIEITDDTPETRIQFELALVDLGLKTPGLRQRAIERLVQRFGRLSESFPRLFYAKALKAVRSDPAAYGAGPVHAA